MISSRPERGRVFVSPAYGASEVEPVAVKLFPSPTRTAVLATSTATFPPPITTVSPASLSAEPSLISRRKLTPAQTPSASSPGTLTDLPPCAPIAG